jgi:fatty acid desaturase
MSTAFPGRRDEQVADRLERRRLRPLNVTYLVVGLVFLGIAGTWALRTAGLVDTTEVGWLLPLMLVVAGAVGLVAGATRGRRRAGSAESSDDPGDDPFAP